MYTPKSGKKNMFFTFMTFLFSVEITNGMQATHQFSISADYFFFSLCDVFHIPSFQINTKETSIIYYHQYFILPTLTTWFAEQNPPHTEVYCPTKKRPQYIYIYIPKLSLARTKFRTTNQQPAINRMT